MTIETAIRHYAKHVGIRQSCVNIFEASCKAAFETGDRPAKYSLPHINRYGEQWPETPIFIRGHSEDLILIAQRIQWFMGRHLPKARIQSPILHIADSSWQVIDHGYGREITLSGLRRIPLSALRQEGSILQTG